MSTWPLVQLGEALDERRERVGSIDADGLPLLGVSNQEGLHRSSFPRIPDMSRYLLVLEGWFAYNPMRINVGSVGWAHSENLSGVISPDYVVFSCKPTVNPRWVFQFLKSRAGLRAINLETAGSVRDRLYFTALSKVRIPLPPVIEQNRILERVELVFANLRRIELLRKTGEAELDAVCRSLIFTDGRVMPVPLRSLLTLREPDITVERHKTYPFAGVYCFGKGVFKGTNKIGADFAYKRLTQIRAGDFIFPKLMAWEGALGIVPEPCDGLFVSPEFPVFRIATEAVLQEVLDVYFKTPSVWPILAHASTGTNVRRRRLHPTSFLNLDFPLPAMDTQRRVRQTLKTVDAIRQIRRKVEDETKSLYEAVLNSAFAGHF